MTVFQTMIKSYFNGKVHSLAEGLTILEAARQIGISIPTLCQDPRLKPCGACRLCEVEVEGQVKTLTACDHLLEKEMKIHTHTPALESFRKGLLKMLAQNYPSKALQENPDKAFHQYLRAYDLESECKGLSNPSLVDSTHPYIRVNMSQCIDCFRCVRICDELQGQFVWHICERGEKTRILPDSKSTLLESSCVSCGACVDTCPTGALEDHSLLKGKNPQTWTKTVCPYCGVGCEMKVGLRDQKIVEVKPDLESPVNKGHLCVKGRYAFDFAHAEDRITTPLIRKNKEWLPVSWEEAISTIANKLQTLLAEKGPQSIGLLASSRATNEENYLAQKFARVVLGTHNIDCCARVCHTPTAAAMKWMLGTGAATNSFEDIEKARTILLVGSNSTENHPIVGARIKQQVLRGAKLIVIDPRKIELASYATYHLPLRPGSNVPLLHAMAYTIVEEKLYDKNFIRERVSEWKEFRDFIQTFSPEKMAPLCGVEALSIRLAARLYATEKPAMCFHGLGMTEHVQGTEGVMCLVNLALLTGNLGKTGSGLNPLRGQNNVQGAAQMGCDPSILTGSISIPKGKKLFEKKWGVKLSATKGLNLLGMIDAAAEGNMQALWITGYDVYLSLAHESATRKAFEKLELVIIQDLFMNETAKKFGHIFLPVASSFEKEGTFMNSERRIQKIRKVLEPPGQAKSDWEIVCAVAQAMGKKEGFHFASAEKIWNEIRQVWPAVRGISYERLEHSGIQWPCPHLKHPGTPILHTRRFAVKKKAALERIEFKPSPEKISQEFPFLLSTGRNLYQFNAGTMTSRTLNIQLRPSDLLEISPEDANKLKLSDGEQVKIESRYGAVEIPILIHSRIKSGELFATFHQPGIFLNRLTSPYRDSKVGACEYKVTAVWIEKSRTI